MGQALTREQVLALAPDDSSAKAAAGLVSDSKWVTLGADDQAVWGECQGSGSKPYQAQVDLSDLVSRCSCPSRKFPCKHGLALLLLYAQQNPRFLAGARPAWVEQWLASRRERAEKKEKAVETAAAGAAPDPIATAAAKAKRETARWNRIEAGTAELQNWICDQFRQGLARFGPQQRKDWAAMAARMVDAQAPGLAPRVQAALDAMVASPARYGEAIETLGLLQLACEATRRRSALSSGRLADLCAALGWSPDKEDATSDGEAVVDRWTVLAQVVLELDTKLSERRVWLWGAESRRFALLQEFAYGGRGWERGWCRGKSHAATLRFFPGSVPLRALATEVGPELSTATFPELIPDAALDTASACFAQNPWLPQVPLWLDGATAWRQGESWNLDSPVGTVPLELSDEAGWSLLAFSGGHAVRGIGEWDGARLRLLGAWDLSGDAWLAESGA